MSKPTLPIEYKVSTELVDNIKVYEVTRINHRQSSDSGLKESSEGKPSASSRI
mgnify:CR=1 FL=1